MACKIHEKDLDETEMAHRSTVCPHTDPKGITGGGSLSDASLPKAIYTAATATAPEGRIIDDSARGTIFWEVVNDEMIDGESGKDHLDEGDDLIGAAKSWGHPFNVEWISTTKLPFYRTRGLRNAWNSNREVKIARDGTEVEAAVGRKLLQMFHRGSGALVSSSF